jgi:hypothetical protein
MGTPLIGAKTANEALERAGHWDAFYAFYAVANKSCGVVPLKQVLHEYKDRDFIISVFVKKCGVLIIWFRFYCYVRKYYCMTLANK